MQAEWCPAFSVLIPICMLSQSMVQTHTYSFVCLQGMDAMQGKLLRTRALWLVAVCGQDLPQELWQEAYAAAVRHMANPDLVVALTAVTAVLEQSHQVMEELQSTQQEHAMMQRTPCEEGAALPPGEVMKIDKKTNRCGGLDMACSRGRSRCSSLPVRRRPPCRPGHVAQE